MAKTTRRAGLIRIAALLTASTLALSACGQADNLEPDDDPTQAQTTGDPGDEGNGGEVTEATIRFSWWGSDARHQMNQELIDAFEAEHPGITVVPDFTDWGGYWDKLATQTAGGDTPDVIMQEERYLREYAERGVLANLNDYDIDTSAIDDSILGSGEFNDGLWGIPTGVNVFAMVADPQLFEEAGVEFPDDTTWTWEDYIQVAADISANTEQAVYGTQDNTFNEVGFNVLARQHGQSLYADDGTLGFDEELLADWWEISLELQDSGAQPPASMTIELESAGPERSLMGTNRGALMLAWSNQLGAIADASGRELTLLRIPGESQYERTGMFFKPAMHLAMSERSQHPEAAAMFIDWMINSPEAGEIILSDRGLPSNLDVRGHIMEQLSETEQQAADFIDDITPEILDSPPVPPIGAGEVASIIMRTNSEVLFERMTPLEAARQFIDEATAATTP